MMEHSSVTLRWKGLGFHQLQTERERTNGGGGGVKRGEKTEGKKGRIRAKEVKKGQ